MRPFIFLDIDGVLATSHQYYTNPKKWPDYGLYRFDDKCVKVFNQILEKTNATIILSSDWKDKYPLHAMNNIFKVNDIIEPITDYTISLWGEKYKNLMTDLEICRAEEILDFVSRYDIENWVAIDDLDLSPWISSENFVHTPRANEGIKQSGIKNKILRIIGDE
jgi:hypothetical protein